METVIIAGGSGAIGRHLAQLLVDNLYNVIIFSRNPTNKPAQHGVEYIKWDPSKKIIDRTSIERADYIINLAGENLNGGKWTKSFQQKIVSSRVESGELLENALKQIPNRVKAVVSASAIGWYGADVPDMPRPFVESDPQGGEFISWVCTLWEDSIRPISQLDIRLTILRLGVVLSPEQGMLKEINKALLYRIAPTLGSGKQRISWIHMEDLCRLFLFALQHDSMQGTYNACASEALPFRQFVRRAARQRYGLLYLPIRIPAFLIRMFFGKKGKEMLLNGTWASNEKVIGDGFQFHYPVWNANCIESLSIATESIDQK